MSPLGQAASLTRVSLPLWVVVSPDTSSVPGAALPTSPPTRQELVGIPIAPGLSCC